MAAKTSALEGRKVKTIFEPTPPEPETEPISEPEKPKRLKRTYHLSPETIRLLENFQIRERDRTDVKPELSDLVDIAIRQLVTTSNPDSQPSNQSDS